ncbi:energy-coupling factor transport system ATP-binding protein [Propionibacterium cyclohexanicum]|uniref:Energy-coupling factor transport system ATP-binding protein n=1 Tax=Propionibacterium cyclohexanicum TaxID=64702 RepID=A0A1H9S5K9_9ACTN|nr:ATP-binding cassette domain-containing protein [Propionibacterium cyclohexanicum]SER80260.1 energy-coupling factor transport system ATP-binding protein [Propionibacterium cyclohexanicum]
MITFDHVGFRYAPGLPAVLDDVSFTIPEGDLCLLVGSTGSGKSTLLNAVNGLVPWFTGGRLSGTVWVDGRSTRTHRPRDLAGVVGSVGQNPLTSFVTDRVEDEIAYGMEQLGLAPSTMRKRVEETLDLMGIADLRNRPLADLSGGQQQRVAIAAVLAAQPRVLVLDEPTSALDPTAAQDVLASITTLVHEVGLTVLLAEHRLERVMEFADTVAWLPGDGSVQVGPAAQVLARADVRPPLVDLARRLDWPSVPLTVRDARRRVRALGIAVPDPPQRVLPTTSAVLELGELAVRYGELVAVDQLSAGFRAGEVTALMGRNGAGKSSLLWAIQGAVASSGRVDVDGEDPRTTSAARARELVTLVPQIAADLLYLPSVAAECAQADKESRRPAGTTAALLDELGVHLAMARDPHDLSEGQRLALVLAIQLASHPTVVLLDEPTRGLDYATKAALALTVRELAARGSCVIVSTHDVEFAAASTDRTMVMADGQIIADGPTRTTCTSSPSFSPQLAKVFWPQPIITVADLPVPVARA